MGKGERIAYDERMSPTIEALRDTLGYYPSLRQIAEYINDGSSTSNVNTSIKRLLENGWLTDEATKIYGVKANGKTKSKGKIKNVKRGKNSKKG
jgi:hypothetical protein